MLWILNQIVIDADYSYVSNILLYSTQTQVLQDLALNNEYYTNLFNLDKTILDIDNDYSAGNTKVVIGIGSPKSSTSEFYQRVNIYSIPFNKKYNYNNNKILAGKHAESHYWELCGKKNLINTLNDAGLSRVINLFDSYSKDKYDYQHSHVFVNDKFSKCSWKSYIESGWKFSIDDKDQDDDTYSESSTNNFFHEKTVGYYYAPTAAMSLAFYSNYFNNNNNLNQKVVYFYLLLRNPVQRAYSQTYFFCYMCQTNLVEKYLFERMKYLKNSHEYFKTMFDYLKNFNPKKIIGSDIEKEKIIISSYINGFNSEFINNYFLKSFDSKYKHIQRKIEKDKNNMNRTMTDKEYFYFKKRSTTKMFLPLIASCYYPPIAMLLHFYNDINKNNDKNNKMMRKTKNDINLKIIQYDTNMTRNLEYKSDIFNYFFCWIYGDNNNQCTKKLKQFKLSIKDEKLKTRNFKHKYYHSISLHDNSKRIYRPKHIAKKLRNKLRKFYYHCNEYLYQLIENNQHLLLGRNATFYRWY